MYTCISMLLDVICARTSMFNQLCFSSCKITAVLQYYTHSYFACVLKRSFATALRRSYTMRRSAFTVEKEPFAYKSCHKQINTKQPHTIRTKSTKRKKETNTTNISYLTRPSTPLLNRPASEKYRENNRYVSMIDYTTNHNK